ncbi:uncharacterized protein cubi_00811 [Cryptosporidium ubiquitum]|uniref:Uncharacterized protein n=1 Tax=Cryptosporidium ubiquitum TaxID=857276 RepID=A0A1J4MB32_9CRYT|nr:uncharacterized protein cubi_00811 [Cryptosporidium ubiquitum]OII71433.1 hypothetical protein cubi_00811 [Cryptosporidium ubiquitum]
MRYKGSSFGSSEFTTIENDQSVLSHNSAEKNVIDSLPILNRDGFGPLTIVATSLNNKFQKRVYSGTFEIPIYGRNSHIVFYEIETKNFILIWIEKHFVGDVIANSGTVFIESGNDIFCLNDLELRKKNGDIISTECPWGAQIFLENDISNFKFSPESIRCFKPQEPPADWNPITSTIFPSNKNYVELIKLLKSNVSRSDEAAFSNIQEDGTPTALLFIIDDKYMTLFLPENFSYSYDKETFTVFRSDGSYYDVHKGIFRTESGLEIVTNAPWGKKLNFDENLVRISNNINEILNSFVIPSIVVGNYGDFPVKKREKFLSKKIKSAYQRLKGSN